MTGQVARATCLAAAIAVLAAALLSLGLVRHAYDGRARAVLRREAMLVADAAEMGAAKNPFRAGRPGTRVLRLSGVTVLRVHADGRVQGRNVLPPDELAAAQRGMPVSAVRRIEGRRFFVEGQPVAGDGSAVLVERASEATSVTAGVFRRLGLAMLVGLAAAVAVAVVVARRLTRPLVRAAEGAHRLATGDRDVLVPLDGPAEVAELAGALNCLSAALTTSEGRQREFLLSISHELRTPLTAIRGYAEALADSVTTGDGAVDAGRTIEAEARRLERLVADLLDLARLGADDFRLELAEVDLAGLAQDAALVWAARCEAEGVSFEAQLPSGSVIVRTDAGRVRQVLDNLAENALRVTPAGRPIVLAVRSELLTGVLEVRDGGPGLREEDLAVAFDRSVLYDRYRGLRRVGTGLGLALVGGLITRLGGVASAGQAEEGGARFSVSLPLARD